MSSTGTRKPRDVQSRASDAIIESDKELINEFKIFAESSNSVAGLAGSAINNSPKTAAGNYLAREGDSMIGPIALGPPLNFRVEIDANNTIDIGPLNENAQFSSNIELDSSQPNSFVLDIIANAAFDGQILIMRTFGPDSFTISQATLANGGNIQTPADEDFELNALQMVLLVFDEALQVFANTGGTWRLLSGSGGGGTTGTFVSADLTADQITNIAVGNHVEFDRNATPTGADGGIVLQTGVGQANGIFELIEGKTYYLSAAPNPTIISPNNVEFVWFDITNGIEIGRRLVINNLVTLANQPKVEIIYTAATDVTVEVRIVNVTTPASFTAIQSAYTFASIYEFSGKNGANGLPGADGAPTWKLPARSKSVANVSNIAAFTVLNDGVTLVEDDRVLLTDQTTLSQNGLYEVGVVTSGFAALTRPTDFDTDAEVLAECFVAIEEGSQFANQLYHLISNNPLTIDVSSQVWDEFAPGTSGGPDMGGGSDGIDGLNSFVGDGRIAVAFDYLKRWELISNFLYPDNGPQDLIYIPSVAGSPYISGRLIVVGDSNQTRGGALSDNYGTTWSLVNGITGNFTNTRLAHDPVAAVLIVVASNSTTVLQSIRRSTDRGSNWSSTSVGTLGAHNDAIWVPSLSLFVINNSSDNLQGIFTSPDGITWTVQTTPSPISNNLAQWIRVTHSPALGKFLAIANSGFDVMTSPDGITWTAFDLTATLPVTFGGNGLSRLIWSEGHGLFLTVNSSGNSHQSTDGLTWIVTGLPGAPNLRDVIIASDLSLFLAVTSNSFSPDIFRASNDGITWFTFPPGNFRKTPTSNGGVGFTRAALSYAIEYGYFFGMGGDASISSPFTSQSRFFRTGVEFNNQI